MPSHSPSYLRGYGAAAEGLPVESCPYLGANEGSRRLLMRWMAGYADCCRRRQRKGRRVRSPIKSEYARQRIAEADSTPTENHPAP
jgi:hypothetical protein